MPKLKERRTLLVIPEDAWARLEETLLADSKSSMFTKDLRKEISGALSEVKDARETIIEIMKKEAKDLLDDPPGTNPEYERGLCELIVRVMQNLGLTSEETCATAETIGKEIGAAWK